MYNYEPNPKTHKTKNVYFSTIRQFSEWTQH